MSWLFLISLGFTLAKMLRDACEADRDEAAGTRDFSETSLEHSP